jgi:two-component system KDP operon response regulator KdpE
LIAWPITMETSHHPKRVFLAEDDDDTRSLIRIALEREGCEVVEARDGAQLINLLGKGKAAECSGSEPDVVVTDVRMPNFSGLGVLRSLRQADSSVPVILITADPDVAIRSDAQEWGASALLMKPFEMEDLLRAVMSARASP